MIVFILVLKGRWHIRIIFKGGKDCLNALFKDGAIFFSEISQNCEPQLEGQDKQSPGPENSVTHSTVHPRYHNMCMDMPTLMSPYMTTNMHTYVYAHAWVHKHMPACIYTCMHIWMWLYMFMYMHVCSNACRRLHVPNACHLVVSL